MKMVNFVVILVVVIICALEVEIDARRGRPRMPADYPELRESSLILANFMGPERQRDPATRTRMHRCLKSKRQQETQCNGLERQMLAHSPGIHLKFAHGPMLRRGGSANGRFVEFENGNYTPDGFLPETDIYTFWEPVEWSNEEIFRYDGDQGSVHVGEDGLYLVYAQVQFSFPDLPADVAHPAFGLVIEKYDPFAEEISDIASAVIQQGGPQTVAPVFTSAVVKLTRGMEVYVKAAYSARKVTSLPRSTFWGLVKLTD